MAGISDLPTLLSNLKPILSDGEFVFVTKESAKYGDGIALEPVAAFVEAEGLTLVIPKPRADAVGQHYDGVFRKITLAVHSSLEAVGLTAAVATALSQHGISANVIAAFHHDHLFVPVARAQDAIETLKELAHQPR